MKANQVMKLLRISRPTLFHYVSNWKIRVEQRTENWIYQYNDEDVYSIIWKTARQTVLYARVSTSSQKTDLENQIETLTKFCNKNWVKVDRVYKDNASWMSLDRKNMLQLIDVVINYKIEKVFITYKDRLLRIWFEMFKVLFSNFWCEIIV